MSESTIFPPWYGGAAKTSSFTGPLIKQADVSPSLPDILTFACKLMQLAHSHPDFVPADDEGDLAAPRVDKAGPAAVHHDVLAVSGAETDGGVVERLAGVLQNCWRSSACQSNRVLNTRHQSDGGKREGVLTLPMHSQHQGPVTRVQVK